MKTLSDYEEIVSLLKRRNSQREYLDHARKQQIKLDDARALHLEEIQHINKRLYLLDYDGN